MKFKAVIFDLDQTLVDSSALLSLRNSRQWAIVMNNLAKVKMLPEIKDLLDNLQSQNMKIGIVTNSPRMYAKKLLTQFRIPYDALIAYHDVKIKKPDPEGFLKILDIFQIESQECISIGDHDSDIIASKSANIKCIGVNWYGSEYSFNESPDILSTDVNSILQHL